MKTRRIHSSAAFVTTLLLSAVLAACGGGGSGGDSNPPPPSLAITAQPVDQSVVAGGIARFTVQATGNGLTYQWQLSTDAGASWSDVSGASGSSLEVSGVTTAQNNNQYRAKVSNGSSTITTSAVTLKVSTAVVAPTIDVDVPASVSATVGGAAAISVTASGTSLGYQWQRSTDGGSSWADISGETAATLNLSALAQDANGWRFRVAVSNSAGTVTSGVTTLQVSAAPVVPTITTAPASMEVVAPATATFTVVAAGQPTPTYQWQRSTDGGTSYTDISGATGASYTTDATSVSGTGAQYRVKVTNSAGSVTSDAAVLTVKAATAAPAIQTQPSNATVTAGGTATFTVAATGTPTPTIQWQVSTDGGSTYANITGATAASYTTGVLAVSDSNKRFRAVVTNSAGVVVSQQVGLTVSPAASIFAGRAWQKGQLLQADVIYGSARVATDDAGNVVILYVSNADKGVYMIKGGPNAPGVVPSFTVPVRIDSAEHPIKMGSHAVAASPGGNFVVTWMSEDKCTADTYYPAGVYPYPSCLYRYAIRYVATKKSWDAPVVVADTPNVALDGLFINDAGDMLMGIANWIRRPNTTISYDVYATIAAKSNSTPSFKKYDIPDFLDADRKPKAVCDTSALDKYGNIVVACRFNQNATADAVAYRGHVTSGLGSQEVLDKRLSAVDLSVKLWAGVNGQAVVSWRQNNGTSTMQFVSTLDDPKGKWSDALDLTSALDLSQIPGGISNLFKDGGIVKDNGDYAYRDSIMNLNRPGGVWGVTRQTAAWVKYSMVCSADTFYGCPRNRSWDFLSVISTGAWNAYDDAGQGLAFDGNKVGYIVGVPFSFGDIKTSVANNGIGFSVGVQSYDTLPSPSMPSGDGRSVDNLWGFYFK